MNRPWAIWSVLAACALLIVGTMGWSTNRVLDFEARQARAESAAELEERVRLSLSRMDTAASGLLVLENQRPPHHFKAVYEPEDVFTNSYQVVGKGIVMQPSPLLGKPPEFVRLHFEIDAATRAVRSPQVPVGNERDYAESRGVPAEVLDVAAREFASLQKLLGKSTAVSAKDGATNLDLICTTCAAVNDPGNSMMMWNTLSPETVEEREARVAQARGDNRGNLTNSPSYQQDVALIEKSKRAEVFKDTAQRAVPKPPLLPNTAASEPEDVPAPAAPQPGAVGPVDAVSSGRQVLEVTAEVTPFQAVWLGDELMAVREVRDGPRVAYQGVWLRAGELTDYLLAAVADLLPFASLERIAEISASTLPGAFELSLDKLSKDPRALVTLPWRLHVGESPVAATVGWSPTRVSLLVGWVALLLALLAAAVLVRGVMKLSERRATFVSSVTHELRTPLTTFHLYSDMLAEGMVKDREKQRGYLRTMRREAERLNHLVENVLAYSRVERGSARTERQKISLAALIERMQPRLAERARKDNAQLDVEAFEETGEIVIDTDITAVEQIVFNLVDNACKYGLPDEGERVVRLRAVNGGAMARLEVCDEGGGIARPDMRKLFRPFHKSARDAAHSKPGVGLGLALCRRLARELGGDLRLDSGRGAGACFVLELPVAG